MGNSGNARIEIFFVVIAFLIYIHTPYLILVLFFHTHILGQRIFPLKITLEGGLEYFGIFRINCQKVPLTSDT